MSVVKNALKRLYFIFKLVFGGEHYNTSWENGAIKS